MLKSTSKKIIAAKNIVVLELGQHVTGWRQGSKKLDGSERR